ncbi:MAG TPA: NfeD family protein [Arenimonas sp.]|jgi:membrane protein implicated in regulation of membrane protease activity|nr:NfeD family protein [Arenimonas sp.]
MRTDLIVWGCVALALIAAETIVPGAFLLWLGLAAAALWLLLWVLPLSVTWQVVLFVLLSFVSVGIYIRWFRPRLSPGDQPLLNRREQQLVGQVFELEQAIVNGRGRLKIGDAFWTAEGPDLPAGTRVRVVAARDMALKVEAV